MSDAVRAHHCSALVVYGVTWPDPDVMVSQVSAAAVYEIAWSQPVVRGYQLAVQIVYDPDVSDSGGGSDDVDTILRMYVQVV